MTLRDELKRHLGARSLERARRLSRLRWATKAQIIRRQGGALHRHLDYVLWDPEVESHTYDVANVDELAVFLARELDSDPVSMLACLREPGTDPTFNEAWARRMRFRFDVKRRVMLANRLLWWGVVRTLRPSFVVECGTYNGIGALVLLRALQRNAADGHPGTLLSIDADSTAGWAVPPHLADGWERITGSTADELERQIAGRSVDMLIHDTPHTEANARHEFAAAIAHRAPSMVLVDSSGGQTRALEELCAEHGGRYRHFRERPLRHFYASLGTGLGLFGW